ncbi:hypothetical protein J7J26_01700 [Candidatus Micrarchaeota archaeon]|nr:hypothetical protein [Candidatus Micrarchaeota archaeon]
MEYTFLEKLGITKNEARIYITLINEGQMTIGNIIKKVGLHRGSTYNIIQRLIEKGLISFVDKENKRYYQASNPRILFSLIEKKEKELDLEKRYIIKLIREIKDRKTIANKSVDISVTLGLKAFKNFFREMLNELESTGDEYYFIGNSNELIRHLGVNYYQYTQNRKAKLGIKSKIILGESSRKSQEKVVGKVRYVEENIITPASTWMYKNKIIIVVWDINPIIILTIKSESVFRSYKRFFDVLWNKPTYFSDLENFEGEYISLMKNCRYLKIMSRLNSVPFIIYPKKENEFVEMRRYVRRKRKTFYSLKFDVKVLKMYKRLWKRKIPTYFLINLSGIEFLFNIMMKKKGYKWIVDYVNKLKKEIKRYNAKVKVIKYTPIFIYISHNKLIKVLSNRSENIYGMISLDPRIINEYNNIFDAYFDMGEDIFDFLEEYLKKNKK